MFSKIKILPLLILISSSVFANNSPQDIVNRLNLSPNIITKIDGHLSALSKLPKYDSVDITSRFSEMNRILSNNFNIDGLNIDQIKQKIQTVSEVIEFNEDLSSFKNNNGNAYASNKDEYISHALYLALIGKCVKKYAKDAYGDDLATPGGNAAFAGSIGLSKVDGFLDSVGLDSLGDWLTGNADADLDVIAVYYRNLNILLMQVFKIPVNITYQIVGQM